MKLLLPPSKQNCRYGVYQWAQRVSSVTLFFISKGWSGSQDCIGEIDSLLQRLRQRGTGPDQLRVFFVLLEPMSAALGSKVSSDVGLDLAQGQNSD